MVRKDLIKNRISYFQEINNKIQVVKGDIVDQHVDVIVNSTNEGMVCGTGFDGMEHAAGVDKAINKAAGPELFKACKKIGHCKTGHVKITPGFKLKCKYIFHAVGPVWGGGSNNEDTLLASCYRKCFELMYKYKLKTIAFPAISTNLYMFPFERAARITLRETIKSLSKYKNIEKIIFVFNKKEKYDLFKKICADQIFL